MRHLLAVLVVAVLVAGCSKDTHDKALVGCWANQLPGTALTKLCFRSDGAGTGESPYGDITTRWDTEVRGELWVGFSFFGQFVGEERFNYRIEGNSLRLMRHPVETGWELPDTTTWSRSF